jgi:hypothetical protein
MHSISGSVMKSQQPAHEQGLPQTYRVDARVRHPINFLLFALAGLFLSIPVLHLTLSSSQVIPLPSLLLLWLFGALPLAWLGSVYNKRVILHRNAIEVVGWFYSRKLEFAEIRGRRNSGGLGGSGHVYVFVPVDRSKRQLVLPPFLQTNRAFRNWIQTIPRIPR